MYVCHKGSKLTCADYVFSDKDTSRRALFTLSGAPPDNQQATSSSTPHPQIFDAATVDLPPENDTTSDDDIVGSPRTALQRSGTARAQAQTLIPPPLVGQPIDPGSGIPASPQTFDSPRFVVPHEIFSPPWFVNSTEAPPSVSAPTLHESPLTAHLVLEDLPATHESPFVAPSPVLESLQLITPHWAPGPHSPVTSPLGFPQTVTDPSIIPPMVAEPLSPVPHPVLGFSQPVTLHQAVPAPTVTQPLVVPAPQTTSTQQTNPYHELAPQHQVTDTLPQVIQGPQVAVVYPSPDVTEDVGGNSGLMAIPTGAYKLRDEATAVPPVRTRRDSIEGVPDVVLFLSPSGYQLSSQQDPLLSPAESILTTPSATPSPDELVPSSQQSLEEYLAIPMETVVTIPTTSSADNPNIPSSQQSIGERSTVAIGLGANTAPNCFRFATRVVPDYSIDRSDFPSWFLERGRLDFVLSVEAGDIWKKLITTWLKQERRVGFGLNEKLVS